MGGEPVTSGLVEAGCEGLVHVAADAGDPAGHAESAPAESAPVESAPVESATMSPGDVPPPGPRTRLDAALADWSRLVTELHADDLVAAVEAAGTRIVAALRAGGKILVAGNGGSAAEAGHVAAEFAGKCVRDRHPLPAISLADSSAALTAIGNDYGFTEVFARGVRAHGRAGDVLVVLSTSGASANVLAALRAARERGVTTIALTGAAGLADGEADIVLRVPSRSTPRIQEVHLLWTHAWCEAVDDAFQPL